MSGQNGHIYEFGEFRLIPAERLLLREGESVPLTPKVFETLIVLVEQSGHLVEKEELLQRVWDNAFVEEANVARSIWTLRKALGENQNGHQFIKTVPKRGYRFVADVRLIETKNERIEPIPEENGKQPETKTPLTTKFPSLVKSIETQTSTADVVAALADWQREADGNGGVKQISTSNTPEQATAETARLEPESTKPNNESPAVKTKTVDLPQTTKQRKGLFRGLKFLLCGLVVGFVFLVLLQVLHIFGLIHFQYEKGLPEGTSNPLSGMIGNLLNMLVIPIVLGYIVGIDLFLFGIARMFYALFEKEGSKTSSSLIERLITTVIIIITLAIAIPNLIASYQEANRNRQIQQTPIGNNKTVAVLPLKPINSANRDELYEIGIADSLIHSLSTRKDFIVRPLSATRKYLGIEQDPIAAGREQRVDYVLASNYQLANGKIRVTSQLLNVANGQIEETYQSSEIDAVNIFAMQDAVAEEIGSKLLKLDLLASNKTRWWNLENFRIGVSVEKHQGSPESGTPTVGLPGTRETDSTGPAAKRGTTNEEAYRLYLQGMYLYDRRNTADARRSAEFLEQAVLLDPDYAQAWAGKAHAHRTVSNFGRAVNTHEEYRKSIEAINKALELDANLADAHSALCDNKLFYEYDFDGAGRECQRAVELAPDSSLSRQIYGRFLMGRGRFDEAVAEIKTAIDLEPTSLFNQRLLGNCLMHARRYDEAVVQYKRVAAMDENFGTTYLWLSMTLGLQGKEAEAFEVWLKHLATQKADEETIRTFQTAFQTSGWQGVLRERVKNFEKGNEIYFHGAAYNALTGDKDKAFEFLEKSYQRREWGIYLLEVDPRLDNLRDDPRFDELVRRVESK